MCVLPYVCACVCVRVCVLYRRQYASFQLQDTALITQVEMGGDTMSAIQDYKSYELKRVPGTQPTTASFRMARRSQNIASLPFFKHGLPQHLKTLGAWGPNQTTSPYAQGCDLS